MIVGLPVGRMIKFTVHLYFSGEIFREFDNAGGKMNLFNIIHYCWLNYVHMNPGKNNYVCILNLLKHHQAPVTSLKFFFMCYISAVHCQFCLCYLGEPSLSSSPTCNQSGIGHTY